MLLGNLVDIRSLTHSHHSFSELIGASGRSVPPYRAYRGAGATLSKLVRSNVADGAAWHARTHHPHGVNPGGDPTGDGL